MSRGVAGSPSCIRNLRTPPGGCWDRGWSGSGQVPWTRSRFRRRRGGVGQAHRRGSARTETSLAALPSPQRQTAAYKVRWIFTKSLSRDPRDACSVHRLCPSAPLAGLAGKPRGAAGRSLLERRRGVGADTAPAGPRAAQRHLPARRLPPVFLGPDGLQHGPCWPVSFCVRPLLVVRALLSRAVLLGSFSLGSNTPPDRSGTIDFPH